MKENELMVDDWVLWKGKQVQVVSVSGVKYSFDHIDVTLAHCNNEKVLESHDIKSIQPIPLTPEILEKNGFTTHISHCGVKWLWIEKQKFELAIDEENGNKITTALGLIDIEIKYVHELQHALKLCGIDKTIEL